MILAQTSPGTVKGIVVDKDGSPLPGATVTLENRSIGVVGLGGVTNAQGEFRITPVPPGKGYTLRVSLPSFQKIEFTLEVYGGKTVVQNVTLREEFKERIRVEGKEETVNTESTQVSTTITSEFISGLPILGTDYQDVLTLAPGVTDVNDSGNPNIHGARDTDVVTLVDGVSTTDPFDGHYGQNLNTESIEEIEVITAGAGAQYGRAQGGFVNIVTKSGGNEFKGSFTLQMRTYRLDGDGAGVDPAELRGGVGETDGFRDLSFNTIYPYLSLSGAFVKDHLWYFFAPQYNMEEFPVNAGTQAYVQTLKDARVTGKLTWQVTSNNKLSLTMLYDDLSFDNQGLGSRVALESGLTTTRGGPTITLVDNAIFTPNFSLTSTVSRFSNHAGETPTLDPDTNGNGLLTVDDRTLGLGGNSDGFIQLRETDPGRDFDNDGAWDVFEDFDGNRTLSGCTTDDITGERTCLEDRDHDGRLTGAFGCEGADREDTNCNGRLDFEGDLNENGVLDPNEDTGIPCDSSWTAICGSDGYLPDTRGNGSFDTEDRNGNRFLDDNPFPSWVDGNNNGIPELGEFTSPEAADQQYVLNFNSLRISGPYFRTYEDDRTRNTLKEDVSYFVPDLYGQHDLNIGMVVEQEGYDATFTRRPFLQIATGAQNINTGQIGGVISAFLPTVQQATNSASSDNFGLYFGDTYKPIPNLTLGFVLRYDREEVSSHGYTFFDPVQERQEFDTLSNYSGAEKISGDLNNDGVVVYSLSQGDPIYGSNVSRIPELANRAETLNSELLFAAGGRLTRHNFLTTISSDQIDQQTSNILNQGTPRAAEDFTITNDNLSPRISVSWDPWADGKSKATASWGRYYDKLFLASVVREEGPDFLTPYYRYDSDGVDAAGIPDNKVGSAISKSPPSAFQVDRSMRTPFSDQFIVGFQREIAPEMSVSLTFVNVKYRDQLQDYDVNHSTRKPGVDGASCGSVTASGYCDEFGGVIRQPPQGSGGEAGKGQPDVRVSDQYPDLFINNMNFNQILRVGNINYQDYVGYELQFVRRLSRKWQMNASYTFSKSKGQADSFLAESGDDPALTELKSGYLEYDQRHVAKFFATAFLPGDWRIGGGLNWASGLPYSFVNRFTAADNVDFPQTRRLYGYRDLNSGVFYEENRNIHRNPAIYDINVRTEKQFVMGKVNASAFFTIENLLNTDDLRVFEIDDRASSLQAAEIRDFGRRYQFGISMNF
jgi:outer membrane receptor protein involved in Fe transport